MGPQTKQPSPAKQLVSPPKPLGANALSPSTAAKKRYMDDIKEEPLEADEDEEEDGQCEESHCCGYVQSTDQDESMDLLDGNGDDNGAWIAFAESPLVSPSSIAVPRKLSNDKILVQRPVNGASISIKQEEEKFLLPDETDYSLPDFTDDDVSVLVGSPSSSSTCSPSSHIRDAMPHSSSSSSVLASPSSFTTLSSPLSMAVTPKVPLARTPGSAPSNSIVVSEKDIPDMTNLFSSIHSPSEASTHRTHAQQSLPPTQNASPSLSILVPASHMYATMFPFSTTTAGAATFITAAANSNSNQFDYFTPPGFTNANNRYLDGSQINSAIFLSAETLSPATKGAVFPGHAVVTANGAPQSHVQTQAQVQVHVNAAAAAAVAMANSAAAISTMRKLNATYGVPIVPLQRSLHPELKPKLVVSIGMPPVMASAASSSTATKMLASGARLAAITASSVSSSASASKATKISITPDISDFKLVQIFHQFCDPATKLITLSRFHQLLQHHQVKDGSSTHLTIAKTAPGYATNSSNIVEPTVVVPSQEMQALFKVLDPNGAGFIDLEKFMNSFQICNRCTEAKRHARTAYCASQGQLFVSTALERQLMEDVAPVIWTWCEGFEKTGNEKCRGTNRHDKCSKYLANCTLWKHKLPTKNRKAQVFENQDSPSKKLKHFA
ncbi:hypothetical protein FI667_g7475, partial [Globisporangium splendens]